MDKKNHQNNLEDIDKLEIEPLSDSDIELVSGGSGEELSCSFLNCSNSPNQV
jgi:hypothetical protein